jgi:hypothetical protein
VRRIFIGDVQGCRQQLEQLLSACGYRAGRDVLYATGDLVSKGPDSIGVLRLLRELGAMPVLGNHDLWWLATGRIPDAGVASWLQAQPIVRVMDDLILIHAGLHPRWTERHLAALSPEEVEFATNVRYCDASGQRPPSDWPPPGPPFWPWDDFYRGRKRVVFGHWARRGLARTDKVVGLDTGCCYGGKLSAWIAEEDRIVQVPGWNKS